MIKKVLLVIVVSVLLPSTLVVAQTEEFLPSAGIVPGSPLFFLERVFENVGTFFTFGEANKARRHLRLAEERLSETMSLAEEGDTNASRASELYEEYFEKAKERADRSGRIDLESEFAEATTRHLSVLDDVIERVPEEVQERVRAAKERSLRGQIESLRNIARRDPEKAAEIFSSAAEGRLNALRNQAERGGEDEEARDRLGKLASESQQYAEFGKEISEMAEGIGSGETEVRALVETATEHRFQILEDVRSRVSEEAQQSIDEAIENASRFQEKLPSDIPGETGPEDDRQAPMPVEQERGGEPQEGSRQEDIPVEVPAGEESESDRGYDEAEGGQGSSVDRPQVSP